MAHNRYFPIDSNDVNLDEIAQVIVGKLDNQRPSMDGSKLVVKLHEEDHNDYPFLQQYQEYNHEEILIVLNNIEWTQPIP